MSIKSFKFDPESIDRFVRFGYDHYANDAKWIPPFESEVRRLLSPKFEFHQVAGNQHCCFSVYSGQKVIGRAIASLNSELRDKEGEPVGAIGFFEAINDYQVVKGLLDTAIDWLKQTGGISKVWGPMNYDIWHGYRFRTVGFDQEPFYGEPYSKPFYPEMFTRYGFTVKEEWDTVEVRGREILEKMIERGASRYRYLKARGYTFEKFNTNDWDNEVAKLHQVMLQSFSGFVGYTPISRHELAHLFRASRQALKPEMSIFARNESGKLAGFSAAYLELGDALREMRGKTNLPAKFRFLMRRRRADCINFYIGGITPEELSCRSGLGRAGFFYVINAAIQAGYDRLMLTLRLKGNAAHALAALGSPKPQREYALFEVAV